MFKLIGIEDNAMLTAEWESSAINELDISSTDLTENCLLTLFARMPKLNYLAVPNCDGFTDQVKNKYRFIFFYFVIYLFVCFFLYSRYLIY